MDGFDDLPGLQGIARATVGFTVLFIVRLAPRSKIRSRNTAESDLHFLRRLRKKIDVNDDYTSKRLDRMIGELSEEQPQAKVVSEENDEGNEILPLKKAGSMQELKFEVSAKDLKYISKKIGALNYLFRSKRVASVLDKVD